MERKASSMHNVWKIAEKVSFNIVSEASYVYHGQKFIKNAKMVKFGDFGYFGNLGDFFENLTFAVKQRYQTSHFLHTNK